MRYTSVTIVGDAQSITVDLLPDAHWSVADVRALIPGRDPIIMAFNASSDECYVMASILQHAADGKRGTNSMVHEWMDVIDRVRGA